MVKDYKKDPQDRLQILINLYEQGQLDKSFFISYSVCIIFVASRVYTAAISNFEQAISIYYAGKYSNLGLALQEKHKPEEAMEAYKKALAIKPDYAEALSNMGNAFQDLGKLEKSIIKALDINDNLQFG